MSRIAKPADNLPSNNQRLISIARLVFGEWWMGATARYLGKHKKQVLRWSKGESEVGDEDLERLREHARQHVRAILNEVG